MCDLRVGSDHLGLADACSTVPSGFCTELQKNRAVASLTPFLRGKSDTCQSNKGVAIFDLAFHGEIGCT